MLYHYFQFQDHQYKSINYYEKPWLKQLRQFRAGQGIEWNKITPQRILNKFVGNQPINTYPHHQTHAAAGFQTSKFD